MFDVSFGELAIIGLVALVVLGPERLPKVTRTVGHLLGRAQRYAATVKADINREMQLEELKSLQHQMESSAQEVHSSVHAELHSVQQSLDEAAALSHGGHETASLTSAPVEVPHEVHEVPALLAAVEPAPVPTPEVGKQKAGA